MILIHYFDDHSLEKNSVLPFLNAEDGLFISAIEYGLIAALVSVAAIAALTSLGESLGTMFNSVATELGDAVDATTP